MPVYKVWVEIRDGEHEYQQMEFVQATSIEAVERAIIRQYHFNDKEFFVVERQDKNGKPDAWREKSDYRIYTIESIVEAKIFIDGIKQEIDLNALMNRPVLPLFSKDADWIWIYDNTVAYWWRQGDMVVEVIKDPIRISPNDSCITILYWSYFDISRHAKVKLNMDWKLTKGVIDA